MRDKNICYNFASPHIAAEDKEKIQIHIYTHASKC